MPIFSDKEITAIMNRKPGINSPYINVRPKFNSDGSGEILGQLIISRIPDYGTTFNTPKAAIDLAMKVLLENPVFYLKGRASLIDNKVALFEPIKFEIGKVSIPLGPILFIKNSIIPKAYAMDVQGFLSEIRGVHNIKTVIIDFVNSRLFAIEGLYAKSAYFTEGKLIYEGKLPEKGLLFTENFFLFLQPLFNPSPIENLNKMGQFFFSSIYCHGNCLFKQVPAE